MSDKRPRIIPPSTTSDADAVIDDDRYQFFGLDVTERLTVLKEKITDREKVIFDLDTALAMLRGVEDPSEGHREEEESICQCANCETNRLTKIRRQMVSGVRQLRRMYQDIS